MRATDNFLERATAARAAYCAQVEGALEGVELPPGGSKMVWGKRPDFKRVRGT